MKTIALAAFVLALAACGSNKPPATVDTAAVVTPAPVPTPAPVVSADTAKEKKDSAKATGQQGNQNGQNDKGDKKHGKK